MRLCIIFADMSVVSFDVSSSTPIDQVREARVAHRRRKGYLTIGGVRLKEGARVAEYGGILRVRSSFRINDAA